MNKIRAIFFDLDGTLAPLDEDTFIKMYMSLLSAKAIESGHDGQLFMKALGEGVKAMYTNDGHALNETVFWEPLYKAFPTFDKKIYEEFYKNDFKKILVTVGKNEYARPIVEFCKQHFDYVILSTNPLFPKVATLLRMGVVGLKEDDFDYITSFENSSFCKPNPAYFLDLLQKFNLKPDEVIVLGNNNFEDCQCAYDAKIKSYLIGDCLIYDKRCTMEFEHIDMDKVIDFLKTLI